jgi:hypothetical protein
VTAIGGHERFTVDPADGWTECECPDSLCSHDGRDGGPVGMRPYKAWTVWDNERDEHAYVTMPTAGVENEYLRKRDAVAVAKRCAAMTDSASGSTP